MMKLFWTAASCVTLLAVAGLFANKLEADSFTLERADPTKPPRNLLDFSHLTERDRQLVSEAISRANLNCPKVVNLVKEAEDVKGAIVRVICSSMDGQSKWGIKMMGYPVSTPTFEPW